MPKVHKSKTPEGKRQYDKKPPPAPTADKPLMEVLAQEEWSKKAGSIPFVSTFALRAYIESQAAPLRKVMMMANGQPIPQFDDKGELTGYMQPSWDDQKEAIYKLLPRVAPELRSVEVTYDTDPEDKSGQKADILQAICDGLNELAHAKRAGKPLPAAIEHDHGEEAVASQGKTKAAATRR